MSTKIYSLIVFLGLYSFMCLYIGFKTQKKIIAPSEFFIFGRQLPGWSYLIMITGAIWEKEVFGQYLLAPAFFWEDVVSFFVIALHTSYLIVLIGGFLTFEGQMWLALVAYLAYIINALQFLLKLRSSRMVVNVADPVEGEVIT